MHQNASNARSRSGGHHFISENEPFPPNNRAIHNVAEMIKAVMSSAAEAELGALYVNASKAVEECQILEEMGHPQPSRPIQTENSTAEGIINAGVQPKQTKAMDMRFHDFYWRPGLLNVADYLQNTTLLPIIAMYAQNSSHLFSGRDTESLHLSFTCKGVLEQLWYVLTYVQ